MSQTRILVTGANGHLGNNIVRHLTRTNPFVTAGMRAGADPRALAGLNVPELNLTYTSPSVLAAQLTGYAVVVHTAAVFKRWAREPEQEIVQTNLRLTENVLEAAHRAGVQTVVYVSSIAALDDTHLPLDGTTWNPRRDRAYPYSKALSEQRAHATASGW
jgi:dihydroflavonol-4-reductase